MGLIPESRAPGAAATFRYPGGDAYEGEYCSNTKHGFGLYFYSAGDAYAGFWSDDQRHGWGLFVKKTGLRYEGCWVNDIREGWGAQSLNDGTRFMGRFEANARHGTGLIFAPSGHIYCGEWRHGETLHKELLFADFEVDMVYPDDEGESDSSSSSDDRSKFGSRLKQIQRASNVASVDCWSAAMVVHFVKMLGFSEVAACFSETPGRRLLRLLQDHPDDNLRRLRVETRYTRRGLHLALLQLLKQQRRSLLLHDSNNNEQIPASFLLTTDVIRLGARIGEGSFGRVYQGSYAPLVEARRPATLDVNVAIKVFRVANANNLWYNDQEKAGALTRVQHARNFYQEFEILSRLKHPNIVLFLGVLVSPLYCIVTEYVPCGSLFDLVHKHDYPLSLSQARSLSTSYADSTDRLESGMRIGLYALARSASLRREKSQHPR